MGVGFISFEAFISAGAGFMDMTYKASGLVALSLSCTGITGKTGNAGKKGASQLFIFFFEAQQSLILPLVASG